MVGRAMGGGAVTTLGIDIVNIPVVDPSILLKNRKFVDFCKKTKFFDRDILSTFKECGIDPSKTHKEPRA